MQYWRHDLDILAAYDRHNPGEIPAPLEKRKKQKQTLKWFTIHKKWKQSEDTSLASLLELRNRFNLN